MKGSRKGQGLRTNKEKKKKGGDKGDLVWRLGEDFGVQDVVL